MVTPEELEEVRAAVARILAMTPEEISKDRKAIGDARAAWAFATEMVPDGQYDEEETAARRKLDANARGVIHLMGAKMGRSEEWVARGPEHPKPRF